MLVLTPLQFFREDELSERTGRAGTGGLGDKAEGVEDGENQALFQSQRKHD